MIDNIICFVMGIMAWIPFEVVVLVDGGEVVVLVDGGAAVEL